ncbi:hypothetical protein DXA94_02340 [Agathobaculum butyriciproducens]|nr:hypothetical protein DXA94_02340 [Agathobaculum butyriciproducens]
MMVSFSMIAIILIADKSLKTIAMRTEKMSMQRTRLFNGSMQKFAVIANIVGMVMVMTIARLLYLNVRK